MQNVLWVPPSAWQYREPRVSREHTDEALRHQAQVLDAMHKAGGILDDWNRELRDIDPDLRLMQAKLGTDVADVTPGFYHLVRLNRRPPPWVQAITGPDGGFVEPNSALLNMLRAADLQSKRAVADRIRHDERKRVDAERQREREAEQLRDESHDRANAAWRTQVLVSPDVAWAQNWQGSRRPTRGKRRR